MKSQPWMLSLALPLKAMRLFWESVSMPIFGWNMPEGLMATLISSRSFLTIQVISSSCSLPLMSSGLMSVRDSGGMWSRRASAASMRPSMMAFTVLFLEGLVADQLYAASVPDQSRDSGGSIHQSGGRKPERGAVIPHRLGKGWLVEPAYDVRAVVWVVASLEAQIT